MKHYVICDKRADFIHDVKMRALLDERDCTITEITDTAQYPEKCSAYPDPFLVVCENLVEDLPEGFEKPHLNTHVFGYCMTDLGRSKFEERKIPCLGKIHSSSQLLSMLLGIPEGKAEESFRPEVKERRSLQKDGEAEAQTEEKFSAWRAARQQKQGDIQHQITEVSEKSRVESLLELRNERERQETELLVKREKEKAAYREKAVVVTIASTKGGVGKTTVATQLSCCFALTSYGRGRFQTCLVDFDTSFGDVCTALDCSTKGPDMNHWIKKIREQLEKGEMPEEICYQQEEIREFLQKKEDTGLYVLTAPQTHTESLEIRSEELEVMMRNLKERGGFDFIIYDTGNDLKDTTLLAMEQADYVIVIATQDISCAHCLDMLIRTLEDVHFDMQKIRLVINNIMSAKATGIAVSELEESFAYPCWAKIRHDPLIIRKNNYGNPVVFAAAHDMTKQLRNVVRQLSEEEAILQPEEPKKSFWKNLFPKKGER